MSDKVPDRRVAKTERTLWGALLALLQDHDWHDITVAAICDRADVARSTFYAHFTAKQDVLDAGFALVAAEFRVSVLIKPLLASKFGRL